MRAVEQDPPGAAVARPVGAGPAGAGPAGAGGVLGGRYRLDALLATGGTHEVWRAEDGTTGRAVAVKTLRGDLGDRTDSDTTQDRAGHRARLLAEARHAGSLHHPGIAPVLDAGEQDGPDGPTAWLVMDLVDGEPLSDVLQRGPLGVPTTLDVIAQTARALAAVHAAGLAHRDVKPGNLLLSAGSPPVVTLLDFGIASVLDAGGAPTCAGEVAGTAYYLPPEQALGLAATPASDLYALGVVAYECLTGARPFGGRDHDDVVAKHLTQPPPALPDTVPAAVAELVGALLTKDPAARPGDATVVARTAEQLAASVAPGAAGPSDSPTDSPTDTAVRAVRAALRSAHLDRVRGAAGRRPHDVHAAATRWLRDAATRRPGRRHRHALRLAVAMLAVVTLGLGVRTWLAGSDVIVPQVAEGQSVEQARSRLADAGLPVEVVEQASGARVGGVLRTEPEAGTAVRPGSTVRLVVSGGPVSPAGRAGGGGGGGGGAGAGTTGAGDR